MVEETVEVQVGGVHSSSEIKQKYRRISEDQRPYALVMANPVGNKGGEFVEADSARGWTVGTFITISDGRSNGAKEIEISFPPFWRAHDRASGCDHVYLIVF